MATDEEYEAMEYCNWLMNEIDVSILLIW